MCRALALCALALAPVALAGDAPVAPAANTPEAVAEYRHVVMEAVKYHMKASGSIVKGAINRPDDLKLHARALADAARGYDQLFPAGSGPDKVKTDALPAVWSQWDKFVAANDAFEKATGELVVAADKGDMAAAGAAMKAVGEACGSCHDTFRKDEG